MSQKKKRKGKKKTKTQRNPAPKRTNLRSVLQSIYNDTVSLETTCNHTCECCSVAMPQINYSEFVQMATNIWKNKTSDGLLDIICTSLEYFFRYEYEKWGMEVLIKPCMFLGEDKMCTVYKDRPLNCRLYGLWPEDVYNERVEKFAKAYEPYGLKKSDLPLNKQCLLVKRVNDAAPLTKDVIDGLYKQMDELDKTIGDFTSVQIRQKENYRTFHDWLLLKILGEDWLSQLTAFILAAERETMEDQIDALKEVIRENFKEKVPDITKTL